MHRLENSGLRFSWIALLVIMVDQLIKFWVLGFLTLMEPLRLLPFFNLTLAYNSGAAFGFLDGAPGWQNLAFGVIAFIICSIIIFWLLRISSREKLLNIALCMILGGAIGNGIDRILYGYVIDYFDFHLGNWHFAIFNFADSMICIGAFLIILHWFLESKRSRSS